MRVTPRLRQFVTLSKRFKACTLLTIKIKIWGKVVQKKAILLAVMTLFASSAQAEHFEVSEPAEDGDSTLVLGEVKVLATLGIANPYALG